MTFPFLFFGHGNGSETTYDLTIVGRSPEHFFAELATELGAWAKHIGLKAGGLDGAPLGVLRFTTRAARPSSGSSLLKLEAVLKESSAAIAFVLRDNRYSPSAWHRDSAARAVELLGAVEPFLVAPSYRDPRVKAARDTTASLVQNLLQGLEFAAPAAWAFHRAFVLVLRTMSAPQREVFRHAVQERVPALLGRSFAFDVVLVELLSNALGIGHEAVAVPAHYREATVEAVQQRKPARPTNGLDWSNLEAVIAAIDAAEPPWAELDEGLDHDAAPHRRTVLALGSARRRRLLDHRQLTIRIANVANVVVMERNFPDALAIYDDVVQARSLDPRICTSLLYAACSTNNGQPPQLERARVYLAATAPLAEKNPFIYLNGAELWCELGDFETAIAWLTKAKRRGIKVSEYRNEPALAPLREYPEFRKLMR